MSRNSVDNGPVRAQVCRQGAEVWRMRFACDGGIGGERLVMLQDWVCCGDLSQLSRAHFIYMRVFNKFNAFDIAVIYGCVGRAAAGSWGMLRIG